MQQNLLSCFVSAADFFAIALKWQVIADMLVFRLFCPGYPRLHAPGPLIPSLAALVPIVVPKLLVDLDCNHICIVLFQVLAHGSSDRGHQGRIAGTLAPAYAAWDAYLPR